LIRPLRMRDLLVLDRIQQNAIRFNLPDSLASSPSLRAVELARAWPWKRTDSHCYVYEERGKAIALVQAEERHRRAEWDVVELAASGSDDEACLYPDLDLWRRLLEYLCFAAGQRGVRRLFARVPEGLSEIQVFHDIGFYTFSHEHILGRDLTGNLPFPDAPIRPQRPKDSWGIQRLYSTLTPRWVQEAEALTSASWDIGVPRLRRRRAREIGYVWEEDDRVVGYLRMTASKDGYLLKVLTHPNRREVLEPILQYGLAGLSNAGQVQVYSYVREYQSDLSRTLEEMEFNLVGNQSLLVKHTTARVRQWRVAPVPARDKKLCVNARPG
jgi:hypothetical protein